MIAPWRPDAGTLATRRRGMRAARRAAAASLIRQPTEPEPDTVRQVDPARAWLAAGWMIACAVAYFTRMFGLW